MTSIIHGVLSSPVNGRQIANDASAVLGYDVRVQKNQQPCHPNLIRRAQVKPNGFSPAQECRATAEKDAQKDARHIVPEGGWFVDRGTVMRSHSLLLWMSLYKELFLR